MKQLFSRASVYGLWSTSSGLSLVALALWVASMPLTGFSIYDQQRELSGLEILGSGWMVVFGLQFAWVANPLFLWALVRLWAKKSAVTLSLLALPMALETILFSKLLLDEGGGSSPVYGYGWGFGLWLLAMCTLVAAAGTRQGEARVESVIAESVDEWLRPFGLFLCALVLGVGAYWSVNDHRIANQEEGARLSGLMFKRGSVCSDNNPLLGKPLEGFIGPLEIRHRPGVFVYPFATPKPLLAWGIPSVRMAGQDYSLAAVGDEPVSHVVSANIPAAAVLDVDESTLDGRRTIHATLAEMPSGRVVFDQRWRFDADNKKGSCPEYSRNPAANQQPRKLLISALGLPLDPPPVKAQASQ